MSGPTVFGPCRPMSTWPLDHVPGPILDLVAWYIINLEKHENTEIAHIDKPKDGGSIFPHRPAHHPFSRDMQACSLVDKSFRHAFVKDGIFSHVVLKKKKQCRLVSKQLGPGARSYVTHLTLESDPDNHQDRLSVADSRIRKAFIASLPNLRYIADRNGYVYRKRVVLPDAMSSIGMDIQTTQKVPFPIPVRQLDHLLIAMHDPLMLKFEHPTETNAKWWRHKMRTLCRTIERLDHLVLQLPALPGLSITSGPLSQTHYMDDPLSGLSLSLQCLSLEISYCVPGDEFGREGYWESYLGWFRETDVRFKNLVIDVYWTVEQVFAAPFLGRHLEDVLEDWGLLYLGWETIRDHTYTHSRDNLPCDDPMKEFIYAMFAHLGHTDSINITFILDLEELGPHTILREIYGERSKTGPHRIDLCHEVTPSLVELASLVIQFSEQELQENYSDTDVSDDMSL